MEHPSGGFYITGMGTPEPFDAGHGALYLEDHGYELAIPVFFSPEALERYAQGIADDAQSGLETVAERAVGLFRVIPLKGEQERMEIAAWAGADCLLWNPAPGDEVQHTYRIPKSHHLPAQGLGSFCGGNLQNAAPTGGAIHRRFESTASGGEVLLRALRERREALDRCPARQGSLAKPAPPQRVGRVPPSSPPITICALRARIPTALAAHAGFPVVRGPSARTRARSARCALQRPGPPSPPAR
jgi:hypothetical protein